MKKFSLLIIILLSILLLGHKILKGNSGQIISEPNKIIIYKDGREKEIDSSDNDFKKILLLTNERINKWKLYFAKDGIDINSFVENSKKNNLGIEFIYDDEQSMDIKNFNGFHTINYYKLYFNLKSEKSYQCEYFQYGNQEKYISSSVGPIKLPNDIIEIINTI